MALNDIKVPKENASGTFDEVVLPAIPSASSSAPSALGAASAGSSNDFSRADHVHAMPSAADVGAAPATEIEQSSINSSLGNETLQDDIAYLDGIVSGLGTAATADIGTAAGEVAAGDHTHTQLHDRSHAITSTSDHTAGTHKIFYSNGDGEIVELALGATGTVLTSGGTAAAPSFEAASGGIGVTTGSVDNAILRADGTGGSTSQSSNINIEDATTSTQNNVAITNQHSGQTNSAIVLQPKGTGAFILGPRPDGTATGGNARGVKAVDLQLNRDAASGVSSGNYSAIVGGNENKATAQGAIVLCGFYNTASAQYSTCSGYANTASGQFSAVIGGQSNTASADTSCSFGLESLANRIRTIAHAAGKFAAQGDAQRIRAVLRCKTTTNTAVEMALNGSTTYLTIPSGKVIFCNIKVVGVKSDGSAVATYERQYAAKNVAGTSSEVFAEVTIGTDNAASTSLDISTVDAGDYISIKPTGIASETWRWVASVDAVEVAYGT